MSVDDTLDERLPQFETLVESTAPAAANPVVCSCDRCRYGPRYRVTESERPAA